MIDMVEIRTSELDIGARNVMSKAKISTISIEENHERDL